MRRRWPRKTAALLRGCVRYGRRMRRPYLCSMKRGVPLKDAQHALVARIHRPTGWRRGPGSQLLSATNLVESLTMVEIEQQLKTLLQDMRPSLRLAMLFGSMSEDRARFDSDIDLGLLDTEPLTAETIFELGQSIIQATGWPTDIVDLYDVPQPITRSALKGTRLFGSDVCFATLYARHLIEQEDFGRLRERVMTERINRWTK